ncbi:MAG: tetratricopeptide repeat protein [Anaerolineae bacterium]|nr:tetratricopeptide repeat protein [Anaerolineae bacterium]
MTKKRRQSKTKSSQQRASQTGGVQFATIEISDDIDAPYGEDIVEAIAEASLALRRGRVEEAKTAFKGIIEREPRAYQAYHNLGAAYMMSGDMAAGEAILTEAMHKFPKYILLRTSLAQLYLQRGEVDKAEEILPGPKRHMKMTSVEFEHLAVTWADLLTDQGDYEGALSWFRLLADVKGGMLPPYWGRRLRLRLLKWLDRIASEEQG